MSQFYLQDSRSHVGDGLTFWAKEGRGYVTNLDQAEVFTFEQATRHRDTDIPWPKEHIDEHAHWGVDCQLMDEKANAAALTPGCFVHVQFPGEWNGNDVYWIGDEGQLTTNVGVAARLILDQAAEHYAEAVKANAGLLWAADYIDTIRRRLVHRRNVNHKQALRTAGVELPKTLKVRKRCEPALNCHGCGRFVSWDGRFLNDCRNCGANNCP